MNDFEEWLEELREEWTLYGPGSDEDIEFMLRHAYQMGKGFEDDEPTQE